MELFRLAQGLAVNRIAFGTGLIVAPSLYARPWLGRAASDERVQVLARALGARDLALGAGGLLALREAQSDQARRWFAAQGMADAVDLLATVAGGRAVPVPARVFAAAMAVGSAAVASTYARAMTSENPPA